MISHMFKELCEPPTYKGMNIREQVALSSRDECQLYTIHRSWGRGTREMDIEFAFCSSRDTHFFARSAIHPPRQYRQHLPGEVPRGKGALGTCAKALGKEKQQP